MWPIDSRGHVLGNGLLMWWICPGPLPDLLEIRESLKNRDRKSPIVEMRKQIRDIPFEIRGYVRDDNLPTTVEIFRPDISRLPPQRTLQGEPPQGAIPGKVLWERVVKLYFKCLYIYIFLLSNISICYKSKYMRFFDFYMRFCKIYMRFS